MELVSIIVPIYNLEKYLERTLESITHQTYKEIEIILVDDGSTDLSAKQCDEAAKNDNRIKVLHQPNSGVSSARNAGLKIASGKFLCFIDGDDIVDKDMIKKLYDAMDDGDMAICGLRYIDDNKDSNASGKMVYSAENAIKELCNNDIISYSACAKLYITERVKSINFDINTGILEDYLFVCNYLCKCKKVSVIQDYLYFYVRRENSALGRAYTHKRLEMIYSYKESLRVVSMIYPNVLPYIRCSFKVELLELATRIPEGDEYDHDKQMVEDELIKLRGEKILGDFKKMIKIKVYELNPKVYRKMISLYRSLRGNC